MDKNIHVPEKQNAQPRFQIFCYCLLAVSLAMLGFTLPDLINDTPDFYHNQHVRLVTGNFILIFLFAAMLFKNKSRLADSSSQRNNRVYQVTIGFTFVLIGIQAWLST